MKTFLFVVLTLSISFFIFAYRVIQRTNKNEDFKAVCGSEFSKILKYALIVCVVAYLASPVVYVVIRDRSGVQHQEVKYILWYSYRNSDGNKRTKLLLPIPGFYVHNDTKRHMQLRPIVYGNWDKKDLPKKQIIRSASIERVPDRINYFFKKPQEQIRSKASKTLRWGLFAYNED